MIYGNRYKCILLRSVAKTAALFLCLKGGTTIKKALKPRDKIAQKMTRDGLVEVNETRQTAERVSNREQDADFSGKKEPEAPQGKTRKQKIRHDPREQPQAEPQKPPELQNQTAQEAAQPFPASPDVSPLPHVPGTAPKQDTGTAERVMERIDAAHTRKASKKAARKAQEEAAAQTKSSRLQFTEEELSAPELERYIEKSNRAADRLDAAKAAIPKQKKLVKERTFDEATGKAKTRLRFEEREKPMPGNKAHRNPLSRPAQEAGIFVHNTNNFYNSFPWHIFW